MRIKRKETALRNPKNYYNWSHELCADRDCVLAAVRVDGMALASADTSFRADREVVLAAVQQNVWALRFASEDLRADREVVLATVQQDGMALQYASDALHADHDIVLASLQQNGDALQYAAAELRADREVVLVAVQQNVWALRFADETLRQDEQFVAHLADVCSRGYIWLYEPQLSLEGPARKAMRSGKGLQLLAKQARASLIGKPVMMKELLLSAVEQGCLEDTLQMLIFSQDEDILSALRTVMAWYGLDVPTDALVDLAPDSENAEAFCNTVLSALTGTCA